ATISAIKYGKSFGFVGFYMVAPAYRGQGYGLQIWNAGLRYLEGRNIGLDGVVAQQENYKKSGFKLAHANIRFEGMGGGQPPENSDIVELSTLPLETVTSYARKFFPEDRSSFIQAWIQQPDSYALGIVENGELVGYGVMRQCCSGYKIGPLFAETPSLAESLFLALKAKVNATETIYLDTPEINHEAVALAQRHNMKVIFETARMYTRESPQLPLDRIFGITSFEIG
ncbi:MAG: GNAT family N-acetyltransferase, partial [Cyanobacteria bacterium J06632_3]